jgi:pilus assembly protein CpaB
MVQSKFGGPNNSRRKGTTGANPLVFVMAFCFLVFTGLGSVVLYSAFSKPDEAEANVVKQQPISVEMVDVLIPISNVEVGIALEPNMFLVKTLPITEMPVGSVTKFEELTGMFAKNIIQADKPFSRDSITPVRPNSAISSKIPQGFRAVTIRVDETTSVEGWARPGARVDVAWIAEDRGNRVASVIVEAAKILSSERSTSADYQGGGDGSGTPRTITLLVSSSDALKIQLAATSGRLTLQLRNDEDAVPNPEFRSVVEQEDIVGRSDVKKYKSDSIIKLTNKNGVVEELTLDERGKLVPIEEE